MSTISAKILRKSPEVTTAVLSLQDNPDVDITLQVVVKALFPNGPVLRQAFIVIANPNDDYSAEVCLGVNNKSAAGADELVVALLSHPDAQKYLSGVILQALTRLESVKKAPKVQ